MPTPVFRLARTIRLLALAAIPTVLLLPAVFWLVGDHLVLSQLYTLSGNLRVDGGRDRLVGLLIGLPGDLIMAYGFWRLAALMRRVEMMDLFGATSVGHLRAFAGAVLVAGLLAILEVSLRTTFLNPSAGEITLQLGISAQQAWSLFMPGVFYVVAFCLQEAQRLKDENDQIL